MAEQKTSKHCQKPSVLTQRSLDIAVTKLIVKFFLPVALADDEHFREYSWGMFVL